MILGKLKRLGFLFLIGVLFINFVQAGDICTIKITANSPEFLIIFTCKSAMCLGFKVKEILEKDPLDYDLEIKEDKTRLLLFLFKREQDLLLQV